MGETLNDAIEFATKVHADQFRKGTDITYILHPLEAAPLKGTKRYKSAQRRIKKQERKQAIRNVVNIFDSLNIPQSTQRPAMAV